MKGALVTRAASFAARAHEHQKRRDGRTPYFAHCARVALIVRDCGCEDEQVISAAFLHDAIEDTTCDYDELASAFGDEVARIVASMTKNMILPEAEREAEYDARLAAGPWQARLIKLADQVDNLRDCIGDGASTAKTLAKCERALTLTARDKQPPVKAAREVLIELMRSAGP